VTLISATSLCLILSCCTSPHICLSVSPLCLQRSLAWWHGKTWPSIVWKPVLVPSKCKSCIYTGRTELEQREVVGCKHEKTPTKTITVICK